MTRAKNYLSSHITEEKYSVTLPLHGKPKTIEVDAKSDAEAFSKAADEIGVNKKNSSVIKQSKIKKISEEELAPDITESLDEGIEPVNFKSTKEIGKKLPKALASFNKGWDAMWKTSRDCQQKWSDEHLSLKFTLTNLRNMAEDAEMEIPDDVDRDIRIVEDNLDSIARVHQWGGTAPMGSAKRQMKNLTPRIESIMNWAKTL